MQGRFFLHNTVSEEVREKVHIYSTIFLRKLRDDDENYDLNAKWAKNIDLFKKDFIFIPCNDALHWSLIAVVRIHSLLERCLHRANDLATTNNTRLEYETYDFKKDSYFKREPNENISCILFLDSLGMHNMRKFCKIIKT